MSTCSVCQKEFEPTRFKNSDRQKYCSDDCKMELFKAKKRLANELKHQAAKLSCDHCKEIFHPRRHINERFCSDSCKMDFHKTEWRAQTAAIRMEIIRKCPVCEKDFQPETTLKQQYCSSKCRLTFSKRIYKALQRCREATGDEKLDHSHKVLGYTPRQLQERIQSHPNWPLVKDQDWHLDHMFPIIAFLHYGIKDIAKICCLDNLQPLEGKINTSKNGTYDNECFQDWLFFKGWWSPLEGTK